MPEGIRREPTVEKQGKPESLKPCGHPGNAGPYCCDYERGRERDVQKKKSQVHIPKDDLVRIVRMPLLENLREARKRKSAQAQGHGRRRA